MVCCLPVGAVHCFARVVCVSWVGSGAVKAVGVVIWTHLVVWLGSTIDTDMGRHADDSFTINAIILRSGTHGFALGAGVKFEV